MEFLKRTKNIPYYEKEVVEMIKLDNKGINAVGTAATVVSLIATIVGTWAGKKTMDDTIQKKVIEALAKAEGES